MCVSTFARLHVTANTRLNTDICLPLKVMHFCPAHYQWWYLIRWYWIILCVPFCRLTLTSDFRGAKTLLQRMTHFQRARLSLSLSSFSSQKFHQEPSLRNTVSFIMGINFSFSRRSLLLLSCNSLVISLTLLPIQPRLHRERNILSLNFNSIILRKLSLCRRAGAASSESSLIGNISRQGFLLVYLFSSCPHKIRLRLSCSLHFFDFLLFSFRTFPRLWIFCSFLFLDRQTRCKVLREWKYRLSLPALIASTSVGWLFEHLVKCLPSAESALLIPARRLCIDGGPDAPWCNLH